MKFLPLMLLVAAQCNQKPSSSGSPDGKTGEDSTPVQTAQNQFAFKLFKEVRRNDNKPSNKLISPLSIYLDLSMAYNGAAGTTQKDMARALQLDGIQTRELNDINRALGTGLSEKDSGVTLDIASALWYRNQGFQPLGAFLKINSTYYHAKVTGAEFSPATVNQINDWVADRTHQKIKTIIEKIAPDDFMYLINAVYFKGRWKNDFDPGKTQSRTFHISGQDTIMTPFMIKEDRFSYLQNDTLQMIELPYGNGDFNMYILLPSEQNSISKLLANLNANSFTRYREALDSVKVRLRLPKWKYTYEVSNLKPELSSLGMGSAFTLQADFSKMYPPSAGALISKVVHKTYIEVNEQGTEAAAATSIGISLTSVRIDQPPLMDVNRPFIYIIAEKTSGALLFIGELHNPAEGGK
jgi:serpin B